MFFSVKVPMKIGGKAFRTCVCYTLTETMKSTVEKLVAEGKAEIYAEARFFCNGKLVAKKEVVKDNLVTENKSKKDKKVKKAEAIEGAVTEEVVAEEVVAEEVVAEAEAIDESEGF